MKRDNLFFLVVFTFSQVLSARPVCCCKKLFKTYDKYENADKLLRNATSHRIFLTAPLAAFVAGSFLSSWCKCNENLGVKSFIKDKMKIEDGWDDFKVGGIVALATLIAVTIKRYFDQRKCVARIKRMVNSGDLDTLSKFYPCSVVWKMQQVKHEENVSEVEIQHLLKVLKADIDGYFINNPRSFGDKLWGFLKSGKWVKKQGDEDDDCQCEPEWGCECFDECEDDDEDDECEEALNTRGCWH
ncbi:hypothetical protein ACFLY6_01175 [Candidatus Dependentiae bacterium]